jgi:sugar/nucleoside kinase (ribokinase family)
VLSVKGVHCAKANIITDPNGTQFTAFSPGPEVDRATWKAHLRSRAFTELDVFVCVPFPVPLMGDALEIAKTANPTILNLWVPGQYADSMSADDLRRALMHCDLLIGNAHEIGYIRQTAPGCLANKSVIETDGARPVRTVLSDGNQRTLPTPRISPAVDPTGCGDAFVAGLIPQLLQALDALGSAHWEQKINAIVRAGIHQAGLCLSQRGSQTYRRR